MAPAVLRTTTYWALLVVASFSVLSAVVGGVGILATDGFGMPSTFLDGGPFDSFTWPGLILLLVVGGSQGIALGLLLARRESALLWTAVAGFGMLIWIYIETGLIGGNSPAQMLYFATGILQLVGACALLGIVTWLPRVPLRGVGRRLVAKQHA